MGQKLASSTFYACFCWLCGGLILFHLGYKLWNKWTKFQILKQMWSYRNISWNPKVSEKACSKYTEIQQIPTQHKTRSVCSTLLFPYWNHLLVRKEEREEKGRKWADGDGKERGGKRGTRNELHLEPGLWNLQYLQRSKLHQLLSSPSQAGLPLPKSLHETSLCILGSCDASWLCRVHCPQPQTVPY